MRILKILCDHCGATVEEEDAFEVGVKLRGSPESYVFTRSIDLCANCGLTILQDLISRDSIEGQVEINKRYFQGAK
jgi:hypothetical protein